MRQGTAPRHRFTIPFDTEMVKKVRALYSQNGKLRFVKKEDHAEMSGSTITVKLTQEDTFCLNPDFMVDIQLRVLTTNGEPLVSKKFTVTVEECLSREVL